MDGLDGIEGLDDGANAHFTFQANQFPLILRLVQPASYLSDSAGIAALLILIAVILLTTGTWRDLVIALCASAAAIGVLHAAQTLVPRVRPQDGIALLGAGGRCGSYPSSGVFLVMLCMILLGKALWPMLDRATRGIFVLLSTLLVVWVCLSQFYLGLHFVTDVIGGIAGAGMLGWISVRLMDAPPTR